MEGIAESGTGSSRPAYIVDGLPVQFGATIANSLRPTVIFSTGNKKAYDDVLNAYHCRNDTHFLTLDVGDYINTLYVWSAQNTETIGKNLAEGIQNLEYFIDVTNLHLMGHSLGAQIMGSAVRHYRDWLRSSISLFQRRRNAE